MVTRCDGGNGVPASRKDKNLLGQEASASPVLGRAAQKQEQEVSASPVPMGRAAWKHALVTVFHRGKHRSGQTPERWLNVAGCLREGGILARKMVFWDIEVQDQERKRRWC